MKKLTLIALLLTTISTTALADDTTAIAEVQEMVKDKLVDGDSAKFKNVHLHLNLEATGKDPKKIFMVCGQVNAKNQMGGYSGYQYFFGYPGIGASILDNPFGDSPSDIQYWTDVHFRVYKRACVD